MSGKSFSRNRSINLLGGIRKSWSIFDVEKCVRKSECYEAILISSDLTKVT